MVSLSIPGYLVVDGSSDPDDSYARGFCVSRVGCELVQVGRDVDGSGRDGALGLPLSRISARGHTELLATATDKSLS
jgi:hypothetical protein